jgi:hemerythrin-like domain-containing protein
MCEYCGCQSLTAIDELTREHDLVVALISDLRSADAAGDLGRMAHIARRITAILGPHTQVEEQGLFPALAADFPEHIDALRADHRRIEAVLGESADGPPADPAWPGRLMDIMDKLREHILKEQNGVFPAALATLSPSDWDAVGTVRSRAGTLLPAAETTR